MCKVEEALQALDEADPRKVRALRQQGHLGNNLKQILDFVIEALQSLWNISEKHFFEQFRMNFVDSPEAYMRSR